MVVESHSNIPSDSGSSVGTVYAETETSSTATSTRCGALVGNASAARKELLELPTERLLHHSGPLRVALDHRPRHLLRLRDGYVRRQRRNLRVDDDLKERRAVGGEDLRPRAGEVIRPVDLDSMEADELGVAGSREVGNVLGAREQ